MERFVFAIAVLLAALAAAADEGAPRSLFLVARHDLPDPNFQDTVVLMVPPAGAGGPIGVIVNRPLDVPLSRVFPDIAALADSDEKLYSGGPVARDRVSFVFRAASPPGEDAIELAAGLYVSSDKDVLRNALRDKNAVLRVFAGFAAWAPGQLEGEIARGDWHTLATDARPILERRPEGLWRELDRRASATMIRLDVAPAASF